MDVNQLVQTFALYALPVLFAITLHEAAHGYVARHFGDMTAHAQGRISLNPIRHVDLVGTVLVPLALVFLSNGRFLFGWAKPVPVNYSALRKPRQHMALVAAAGPGSNLLMALVWALAMRGGIELSDQSADWLHAAQTLGTRGVVNLVMEHGRGPAEYLIGISAAGVIVNLVFMLLNLLPIPPLDGGRILTSLLPRGAAGQFARLEPWGIPLLFALLLIPVYGSNALNLILSPLLSESEALLRAFVLL